MVENKKGEEIARGTNLNKGGSRHTGELLFAIIFIIIGLAGVVLTIVSISLPFTAVPPTSIANWIILILFTLFIIALSLAMAIFGIGIGLYQLRMKPDWSFILYEGVLEAEILAEPSAKEKRNISIKIDDIKRCVILRRRKTAPYINSNKVLRYEHIYLIGLHVLYMKDGKERILSFENAEDIQSLEKAILYLQNDCRVSMYYSEAIDESTDKTNDYLEIIDLFPPSSFQFTKELVLIRVKGIGS